MKKIVTVIMLIITMSLTGCGADTGSANTNTNSLGKNVYEFVSVSTNGDTVTAAQMNGLGSAHPTVSFTDKEMNLFYVAQYPPIEYTYVSDGKYKLAIVKEDGGKAEIGTLTEDSQKQIQIYFSIEGTNQTYVFKCTN